MEGLRSFVSDLVVFDFISFVDASRTELWLTHPPVQD
jgi:hypothetical protein